MKLNNVYTVINKVSGKPVGFPVYSREDARVLKRDTEAKGVDGKLSIVKMIISGVVR